MAGILENLQQQVEDLTAAISKLSDRVKDLELAGGLSKNSNPLESSQCNEKPISESGYVTWDESHYVLTNMRWKSISSFRSDIRNRVLKNMSNYMTINKNTRFPEDELYVEISDPEVQYQYIYNREQYREEPSQLLPLFKNHMHTRRSFEEKYKLRWLDPKEQNSENKENIDK